jgi:hypothetical protein
LGLVPYDSCSWSFAPQALCFVPRSPELWKYIFCPCRASTVRGQAFTGHCRHFSPPSCLTFPLCIHRYCPLPFLSQLWTSLGLCHLRLDYAGFRMIWTILDGLCHPRGRPYLGISSLQGNPGKCHQCLRKTMIENGCPLGCSTM